MDLVRKRKSAKYDMSEDEEENVLGSQAPSHSELGLNYESTLHHPSRVRPNLDEPQPGDIIARIVRGRGGGRIGRTRRM